MARRSLTTRRCVLPGTGRVVCSATSSGTFGSPAMRRLVPRDRARALPLQMQVPTSRLSPSKCNWTGRSRRQPDGLAITYFWKNVGRSAWLRDATSATPTVQFGEGFGEYEFELTVTDSKGQPLQIA